MSQIHAIPTNFVLNPNGHMGASGHSFSVVLPDDARIVGVDADERKHLRIICVGDGANAQYRNFKVVVNGGDWIGEEWMYIGKVTVAGYGQQPDFSQNLNTQTTDVMDGDWHSHIFNPPEIVSRTYHVFEV